MSVRFRLPAPTLSVFKIRIFKIGFNAFVVKLVDTPDSKSGSARSDGSSPSKGTILKYAHRGLCETQIVYEAVPASLALKMLSKVYFNMVIKYCTKQ